MSTPSRYNNDNNPTTATTGAVDNADLNTTNKSTGSNHSNGNINANKNFSFQQQQQQLFSRGSKLLLKVLSHDENGREIIILFDPEEQQQRNQHTSSELIPVSSSSTQQHHHQLVHRVSSVVGGGPRRAAATASIFTSVGQPHLIIPTTPNNVTLLELQQILTGEVSIGHHQKSERLTDIPIQSQLIRFEGNTIVDPTSSSVLSSSSSRRSNTSINNPASITSVADALFTSQTQSLQILQRTIHLYDAGHVLEEQKRDANVGIDIGSVLAAPRWVAPVFNNNSTVVPSTTSPAIENNNNEFSQPRMITASSISRHNNIGVPPENNTLININNNETTASYQNSPSSRSPLRYRSQIRQGGSPVAAKNDVVSAERFLEATVQAEVERLGSQADVNRIVDEQTRSPQVKRAMALVERARATAQVQLEEQMLKMKVDEEIHARQHLESLVREQERVSALRGELERMKSVEHEKRMRSMLPGHTRSADQIAKDTDLLNLPHQQQPSQSQMRSATVITSPRAPSPNLSSTRTPAMSSSPLASAPPPSLQQQQQQQNQQLNPQPVVPSRRITVPTNDDQQQGNSIYQQRKAAMLMMPPMAPPPPSSSSSATTTYQHRDYIAQNVQSRAVVDRSKEQREYFPLNLHTNKANAGEEENEDDIRRRKSMSNASTSASGGASQPIVLDRFPIQQQYHQNQNQNHQQVSQARSSVNSIHSYSPGPAPRHQNSNYVDRVMGAVRESMTRN